MDDPRILDLGVALAIGMLIGAERERSKGTGPGRATAGLRTFAVASLCGAVAFLAGGLAVVVTILLFAKARLHGFVRSVVSTDELNDALILAAATVVILPLLPDRQIGPYGALNPRSI